MFFFSCAGDNMPSITVSELKEKVDDGNDLYLLDVRTEAEFKAGHLPFADKLIPYDSLQFYLDELPQDKETEIYCFCRSGRRSGISTNYLKSIGYENVYNVTGGIIAWNDAGYKIISDQ